MLLTREVFPETQRLLQRLYRQSRHHQVRQRAHCILLSTQGYKIAQLIEIFGVSRKTLYNWFNSWEAQGVVGLYNRKGRGRKSTFNSDQIEQIRLLTQQYPRQLKQVVQKVQEEWGISISTKTIKRVIGRSADEERIGSGEWLGGNPKNKNMPRSLLNSKP